MSSPSIVHRLASGLQFNLGTLLLMVTLCGAGMGYWLARSNRLQLTTKLNSWSALKGLPEMSDVTNYHSIVKSVREEDLAVWVPSRGKLKLCWVTNWADDALPRDHKFVELTEGRHAVTFQDLPHESILTVDGNTVFNRRHTKDWNVGHPITWQTSGDQVLNASTTLVLDAPGVATLGPDEVYDVKKHRFGLRIWLVR